MSHTNSNELGGEGFFLLELQLIRSNEKEFIGRENGVMGIMGIDQANDLQTYGSKPSAWEEIP